MLEDPVADDMIENLHRRILRKLRNWLTWLAMLQCGTAMAATPGNIDAPEIKVRPVRVRVVDESGAPLAGVEIHRSVWTEAKFPPNADFMTGADGWVSFEVPEQVSIFRLWASMKDHVPMFANFDARMLGRDPVPSEHTFKLAKGTTIGGFVVDDIGAPITQARVEVEIQSRDSGGKGEAVVNRWLATGADAIITDEHGFWAVSNVPAGTDWKIGLRATHPEHVSDVDYRGGRGLPISLAQLRDQSHKLVMERGVKVSGTITSPEGKPVAGALVIWGDTPYHNTNIQEALTDEAGRYHLPPLRAVRTPLTVVAEGHCPVLTEVELSGRTLEKSFLLRPGRTVTFRFVDAAGNPVPKAQVNITKWRERETLFNWRHSNVPYSKIPDRADDAGVYVWKWAPDDVVEFMFSKKGYLTERERVFGPGTHDIVLQPGRSD